MHSLKFKLPVYWERIHKKKMKKTLLGLNWALNANHWDTNKAKKWYLEVVRDKVKNDMKAISGPYIVKYTYNYKNIQSDMTNVVPVISKFFLDALQELALVDEDNVEHCLEEHSYVGEQNKTDPHIIVEVELVSSKRSKKIDM